MFDLLFETSWEVCNKVGGIYAVLSTKAKTLQKQYKDKVVFIGPDLWSAGNESPYFVETRSRLSDALKSVNLPLGVTARAGRWNVPGKPLALLVKYDSLYPYKNELYAEMWTRFGVDSLHAYGDYDESCMFAYAAALTIEALRPAFVENPKVIAHFDEWITGMGLLYVKWKMPEVATVFTTHATSIGRSICGNGKPLYDYLPGYFGDQMAGELNMQSKHSLEKAAAHAADVFTTVSEVTARECEQLLERRPMVTPNGFEQGFVPRGTRMLKAREAARKRMLTVASALTGEKYDDNTMLIATSGRCEFRNKGIDAYLDALNQLRNNLYPLNDLRRKIIAFVMVPAWVKEPRADLAQALGQKKRTRLFNPVITHVLHNPESDAVYGKINALGMHNELGDTLKVIDVPSYLTGSDGIFNMSYYDLLPGLDATVFPSYYEPWGYTPLESIAFGVPTITTDLSGFGQWVKERGMDKTASGVNVLHRSDGNYDEVVAGIAGSLLNLYMMDEDAVKKLRRAAAATSKDASWDAFMPAYYRAYEVALAHADQ